MRPPSKSKGSFFPVLHFTGILLCLLLVSCGRSQSTAPTQRRAIAPAPGLLRVGISADSPPLSYTQRGQVTGLETVFAKGLARYTGKEVTFVQLSQQDQIKALEDNVIDIIMAGMSITPRRQQRIAFATPYLRSGQILLVRRAEESLFDTGIYRLMHSRYIIGTVTDSSGDHFISRGSTGAKVMRFTAPANAVQALLDKKIDAFVYDAPTVCYYAAVQGNKSRKLSPILTLATTESLAWGIRKEDHMLTLQANSYLNELKNRQELQVLLRTWIPYL